MTDIFETRVENLEPKEEKKRFSAADKKSLNRFLKKRKREDSDSAAAKMSLKKAKKRKGKTLTPVS